MKLDLPELGVMKNPEQPQRVVAEHAGTPGFDHAIALDKPVELLWFAAPAKQAGRLRAQRQPFGQRRGEEKNGPGTPGGIACSIASAAISALPLSATSTC